ncbi:MAG: holB [Proteobacteria bacterium]|nr:holB [Pseudomonadota bacterium]
MIYSWQQETWDKLTGTLERLPHALLLAGPPGSGKRDFAEALSQRLLCESSRGSSAACGECASCNWFKCGNHPDFRLVVPESEAEGEPSDSRQIVIEQVRALNAFVSVGTHRQGMRVILIDPAEAMNTSTANALLKLLEEPTQSTLFLLISRSPRRLLPTIRSRCQTIIFGKPDASLARQWLADRGGDAEALLRFAGGMPLAAAELGGSGAGYRTQLIAAVTDIETGDPLRIAAAWESWLKQKDDEAFVPQLPVLVAWLQKWVFELVSWKIAGRSVFFPDVAQAAQRLAMRAVLPDLFGCYNELTRMRAIAEHPLNPRLFLEDMLLRYARAVTAKGVADV